MENFCFLDYWINHEDESKSHIKIFGNGVEEIIHIDKNNNLISITKNHGNGTTSVDKYINNQLVSSETYQNDKKQN